MQFYNEEILFESTRNKFPQQSVVPGSDVNKIDAVFYFFSLYIPCSIIMEYLCEEYFNLYNTRMIWKIKYLVRNDAFPANISAKEKSDFFFFYKEYGSTLFTPCVTSAIKL